MNESRVDFSILVNIGDHLSSTQNLTAEQHGGYFWLLLYQWRNGRIREEEMGTICRFPWINYDSAPSTNQVEIEQRLSRVLAPIKQLLAQDENGLWYSPYYERKKYEYIEKHRVNSERARKGGLAKAKKWRETHAPSTAQAVPEQCSDSAQTVLSQSLKEETKAGDSLRSSPGLASPAAAVGPFPASAPSSVRDASQAGSVPKSSQRNAVKTSHSVQKKSAEGIRPSKTASGIDPRFAQFRDEVLLYWKGQNPRSPVLHWEAADGKALGALLQAEPQLDLPAFRRLLAHRASSDVVASTRPRLWLRDLLEYNDGPLDRYKRPKVSRSL